MLTNEHQHISIGGKHDPKLHFQNDGHTLLIVQGHNNINIWSNIIIRTSTAQTTSRIYCARNPAHLLRTRLRICDAHTTAHIHCANHCVYLTRIPPRISFAHTPAHAFCAYSCSQLRSNQANQIIYFCLFICWHMDMNIFPLKGNTTQDITFSQQCSHLIHSPISQKYDHAKQYHDTNIADIAIAHRLRISTVYTYCAYSCAHTLRKPPRISTARIVAQIYCA